MELVRLYGVGGLAGAVNPANLKTHLGVFLMLLVVENEASSCSRNDKQLSRHRNECVHLLFCPHRRFITCFAFTSEHSRARDTAL